MIGKNIRAYTTGKSRRRIAIVLLLLLALLGIGIGGLPNGGEQTQPVTVTAEGQNDEPIDSSGGGDETGDGPSNDQDGSADEEESQSTNEDNNDAEGADTVDDTGSSFTTTGNSPNGGPSTQQGTSSPVIIVNKSEMNGQVDSVMPGDSGNVTLNVTNDGNGTGTFGVKTSNVTDYENGLTEPEAEVDASGSDPGEGEGELSAHLEVRWSLINSTGDRVYLTDNDSNDDYVPIRTLNDEQIQGGTIPANESADALFEWKVPKATGNEIQGDAVEFDVDFTLVSSQ